MPALPRIISELSAKACPWKLKKCRAQDSVPSTPTQQSSASSSSPSWKPATTLTALVVCTHITSPSRHASPTHHPTLPNPSPHGPTPPYPTQKPPASPVHQLALSRSQQQAKKVRHRGRIRAGSARACAMRGSLSAVLPRPISPCGPGRGGGATSTRHSGRAAKHG